MAKLTEKERLERKFRRRMIREWRRELVVSMANEIVAVQGNYLTPSFKLLIKPHL